MVNLLKADVLAIGRESIKTRKHPHLERIKRDFELFQKKFKI